MYYELMQFQGEPYNVLGYPHADIDHFGLLICFLAEFFGTFFLVLIVYATVLSNSKPQSDVYGLCIGGAYGMALMTVGPISGAALNPFRVMGPAIVS